MAFFITNIVIVYPDFIECNGISVDRAQCVNQTAVGTCDEVTYNFEGNWTHETLIKRWNIILFCKDIKTRYALLPLFFLAIVKATENIKIEKRALLAAKINYCIKL